MKLLCLILLNMLVMADVSSVEKSSPYKVIILDPAVDASKLKPHKIEKKLKANDFPSVERRDSDFKKAELVNEVASLDDLDRDVLWFDAKNLPINDVQKKYPQFSKEKIEKLSKAAKK